MKLLASLTVATLGVVARADQRGDTPGSLPSTPAEQLAKFHVPPGFEVQLVAAEPEIQKPINLNFDAAGRLWVTGSEQYPWPASMDPNGQPIANFDQGWRSIVDGFRLGDAPEPSATARDTVRVLGDFDRTGHARKITVFADKLNIPGGVQPLPAGSAAIRAVYGLPSPFDPDPEMRKRGPKFDRHLGQWPKGDAAIVYSIPNIWLMADWDGDGFAESRIPLYTGFGYTDTHGGSSSYIQWIDGWIYGTHGFRNHSEVTDRNGNVTVLDSGNTYRFKPDGTAFEIFAHGQTNPFGLAFDPLGNLFSADSHSKPVYLLVHGGFYEGIGKQHDGLGFAPRITDDDHGSSAIAGIACYTDDQWPEEFRSNLFNGNPVTQKINRDRLEWHGSTPQAIRMPDFLTCDDPWFRPVNLKLGPDGALYIADFYNPIIGHYEVPLTDAHRDHAHGRIWRVVYRGESASKARAALPETSDLTQLDTKALIEKLADSSLEVRRLATNELLQRDPRDVTEPLRAALLQPSDKASGQHWESGNGKGLLREEPLKFDAVTVQRISALWALQRMNALDRELLKGCVQDSNAAVRTHALKVIAERPDFDAEMWGWTNVGGDPQVTRAAAETRSAHPSQNNIQPLLFTMAAIPAADVELRYAARVALRDQLLLPGAFDLAASLAANHPAWTESLADAALGAKLPEAANFLLKELDRTALESPRAAEYLKHAALYLPAEQLSEVTPLIGKLDHALLGRKLAMATSLSDASRQRGAEVPPKIAEWAQAVSLEGLASQDDALAKMAIAALREARLEAKLAPLATIVRDEQRDGNVRLAALEASANLPASRELLRATFTNPRNAALRKRAAELLVQNGATDTVLATLSKEPWEIALAIAGALSKSDAGAGALLAAVETGNAPARLLNNRAVAGNLFSRPKALQDRAKLLTKDLPPEDARLNKVIADRAAAFLAAKADAAHGAQVFQQQCAVCHRFRNAGGNVGPNLDGAGARGPQRLLEDILDPNRNVDPGFRQTVVETTDGQTLAGTNLREQADAIALIDATGRELLVPKVTIKSRATLNLSMMPPIFETQLAAGDLNDLVGYLLSTP